MLPEISTYAVYSHVPSTSSIIREQIPDCTKPWLSREIPTVMDSESMLNVATPIFHPDSRDINVVFPLES